MPRSRPTPASSRYLLDPESLPFERPPHVALGSREEAADVAESLGDAYEATVDVKSWLRTRTTNRGLRSRIRNGRRADQSAVVGDRAPGRPVPILTSATC
jgi:hypothetical protein